jgi:hypothetical protein
LEESCGKKFPLWPWAKELYNRDTEKETTKLGN